MKKKKGPTLCPLAPAHMAWLGAVQVSVILAFFSREAALVPLALFIIAAFTAPFIPGFSFYLPIISRGKKGARVSLTFDDGPDPDTTPELLGLLKRHGVKAAFFVTGAGAEKHPGLIRDILSAGHEIGNHTYGHDPFLMLRSVKTLRAEVLKAQKTLGTFGIEPVAFRPPVGITSPRLWRVLLEQGMYCVNFSNRPADRGNRNISGLSRKVLRKLGQGDIILLHDRSPGPRESVEVWLNEIDMIIKGIKERGYAAVPLSELTGRPVMKHAAGGSGMNPVRSFYNALAREYDKEQFDSAVSWIRKREISLFRDAMIDLLAPGSTVLEIGAGTGLFTIPAAERCGRITAVDISEEMLCVLQSKAAARGIKNINISAGNIEEMVFPEKFDCICSFSAFEYIPDLESLISRLAHNIKPGGFLYFTTANRSLLRFFAQIGNAMRQGIWLHARSGRSIRKILVNAGLVPEVIESHIMKLPLFRGQVLEVRARK